jgi:uncharacterized membrane protein YeaQ/YmgE (transglycosylase-associated protein family)
VPLWLRWIVLGLVAGGLAKYLMPGRDPSGCIVTTTLGILGAFIGGLIGTQLGLGKVTGGPLDLWSLALATLGAVVILAVGRVVKRLTARMRRNSPRSGWRDDRPDGSSGG